jgi:Flp pilus assembly protein TadG
MRVATSMAGVPSRLRPWTARRGATLMEYAIITPITFLLILGLVVGGLGIFRYQEVSSLAREASRYASTHGGQYTLDGQPTKTGVAAVSSSSDIQAFVAARAVALDPNLLTAEISWSSPATINPRNIPSYVDIDVVQVPPAQKATQNYVTVTVTYIWMPELYLTGPITLTSTSKIAMTY